MLKFIKSYFSDFYFFMVNDNTMQSYYCHLMSYARRVSPVMASVLSAPRQHIMLDEWRQSSLSTASTYFIHILYIISCILVRTKVFHTFLLLFTSKARVISVIFRGEHQKIDAELLSTFTNFVIEFLLFR